MKCGRLQLFPSMKAGVPSGPETTCTLWSTCAFRRPTELPPRRPPHSGGNRRAAWIKQKDQKAPKRNEFETPFGELIITGGRLMAARTDRPRTFARTHSNLNTLMIGTEAGLLVNESRKVVTAV